MCIVLWFYIVNTKPRNRFQFVEELKPTDRSFYWILTEGKHICLARPGLVLGHFPKECKQW